MLERFICLDNVGIFKNGVQTVVPLKKLALIYADNARGKSTLSSVMLACATGDVKELQGRKTIGATTDQKVVMRFAPPGAAAFNAEFATTGWAGAKPNFHVFNQTFVERNVFASGEVLPEQREALLNLALGQEAVAEREKFEQQSALQKECAGKVSAAEGALSGFRGQLSVDQFINFEPLDDVDAQLETVDKEITEARASSTILNRSSFRTVPVPGFDLTGIEVVLSSSFTSLAIKAERDAKEHFIKHNGPETERWVVEGMQHKPEEECPFCGQKTTQLDLLKSYKEYFDGEYTQHLDRVANLQHDVNVQVDDRQVGAWAAIHEGNQSIWQVWSESLKLKELPDLDVASFGEILGDAMVLLTHTVETKGRTPHVALDVSVLQTTKVALAQMAERVQKYNDGINELNQKVAEHKQKLAHPNVPALVAKRKELVVRKNRYEATTVELVKVLKCARDDYKAAEKAKDDARDALNKLMADTLAKFQAAINEWLTKFAAPFRIDKLAPTYAGGDVRSEYVLKVRGATVIVGPRGGGDMSFQSALSEGDKRTLAYAFFLATLFADPKKESAVVVLDDVFTSLDKHRRHNTIEGVLRMLAECAQVIALGHDAHFLRELKKWANKKKLAEAVELNLQRDAQDFSYLDGAFDLDDYCSSDYYKHYVLVERYVAAEPGCDKLQVAKALRPLVEGYLHRCFPKKFKEGQTVGDMLDLVKNAVASNSLVRLQGLHGDLVSFNDFAAAFHHDTSGGYPRQEVTDAELLPFAQGALGFIQMRSFRP